MALVIGCDVGSQSLKGVLLDGDGTVLAEASAPYDLSYPHPGWADQDPEDWMAALGEVIGRLLEGRNAGDVGAIGFASQVDGVVAVGEDGRALRPAIIWMDRRAQGEVSDVPAELIRAEARNAPPAFDPSRLRRLHLALLSLGLAAALWAIMASPGSRC